MWSGMKMMIITLLVLLLGAGIYRCEDTFKRVRFIVKEAEFTRLCETKKILTVNGKFPGPTLYANKGDTIFVDVHNQGNYNITIHWHGVKLPRYPWSDGPEYITQCPIMPGGKFRQKVIFSSEEGTLFWHAHSDWSRATVHGAIVVYPKLGSRYPFRQPDAEFPIIFGEWWKRDVMAVVREAQSTGGDPDISDAFTINGRPGDFYPCPETGGTYHLNVHKGRTYLLRIINAALNDILFFAIAKHKLTVVGADASYTKPLTTDFVTVAPGQTLDALLHANQDKDHYYMAARAYASNINVPFDNTTATAILRYYGNYSASPSPSFPCLPDYNDTAAAYNFSASLKSLASKRHPAYVPSNMTYRLVSTLSLNTFPCVNNSCAGPNGSRLAASMNNISFVNPSIDILQAYYARLTGVFTSDFPIFPPLVFNFTDEYQPLNLLTPEAGTRVLELDYGSMVELVMQGTTLLAGIDHPMHVHGHSFYIVGSGFGNFDKDKDPLGYNLVDPPYRNTAIVPKDGWTAIRFNATNPGVWFVHCHFDRHNTWGMDTVLIVKNGPGRNQMLRPPPSDMPPC